MYESSYVFPMIVTLAVGAVGVLSTHACLMPESNILCCGVRRLCRQVRSAIHQARR